MESEDEDDIIKNYSDFDEDDNNIDNNVLNNNFIH